MSPKSISPVMPDAPGAVLVKMLVRVTSAWLRPAGSAVVASAAAASRAACDIAAFSMSTTAGSSARFDTLST
jgi:hypothetical protein